MRKLIAALSIATIISGCTTAKYNPKTGDITYGYKFYSKKFKLIEIKTPEGASVRIEGAQTDADALIGATHDLLKTAAQLAAKVPVAP